MANMLIQMDESVQAILDEIQSAGTAAKTSTSNALKRLQMVSGPALDSGKGVGSRTEAKMGDQGHVCHHVLSSLAASASV